MEKNPYTMAKLGLTAKENLRPKHNCCYYTRYFFLFLSLIQFLIILGLVLFMVYGNTQAGTEKHIQELESRVQERNAKVEGLEKKTGDLSRQLNASTGESRMLRQQLGKLNVSVKTCLDGRVKMQEELKNVQMKLHMNQHCCYTLQIFNATYPVQLTSCEQQLKVSHLMADIQQQNCSREMQLLQDKVKTISAERDTCSLQLMTESSQWQTSRLLKSQIMEEFKSTQQDLKAAVDTALPAKAISCWNTEVRQLEKKCQELLEHVNVHLGKMAEQIEVHVSTVSHEKAKLEGQTAACSKDLEERSHQLTTQHQQFLRTQLELQEAHNLEKKRAQAEQQKLQSEKESLEQQLDQARQACLPARFRIPPGNTATRLLSMPGPGGAAGSPSVFSNPPNWSRTGPLTPPENLGNPGGFPNAFSPGNVGSYRNPSNVDSTRLEANMRPVLENSQLQNQPPVKPEGRPSG